MPRYIEKKGDWRSAQDPKTGRIYYYNVKTRKSQWDKPDEMCSEAELEAKQEEVRRQKEMFRDMESHILADFSSGSVFDDFYLSSEEEEEGEEGGGGKLEEYEGKENIRHFSSVPLPELKEDRSISVGLEEGDGSLRMVQEALRGAGRGSEDTASQFTPPELRVRTISTLSDYALEAYGLLERQLSRSSEHSPLLDFSSSYSPPPILHLAEAKAQDLRRSSSLKSGDSDDDRSSSSQFSSSFSKDDSDLLGRPTFAQSLHQPTVLTRRNSTGTIYMASTMSQPDIPALIKCVCVVVRAHMLAAFHQRYFIRRRRREALQQQQQRRDGRQQGLEAEIRRRYGPVERITVINGCVVPVGDDADLSFHYSGSFAETDALNEELVSSDDEGDGSILLSVFNDRQGKYKERELSESEEEEKQRIPSLEEILSFYSGVYKKAQLEIECVIISLIYLEKLLKTTRGYLFICYYNWRPILFASMILSSKVWDDLSMWNVDFSHISSSFTLQRINELEMTFLHIMDFSVKVSAGDYAKYYFYLRSLSNTLHISHELEEEDEHGDQRHPLNLATIRKLDDPTFETESHQKLTAMIPDSLRLRSRAMTLHDGATDEYIKHLHETSKEGLTSPSDTFVPSKQTQPSISFEQIIHTTHTDADGSLHSSHHQHHHQKHQQHHRSKSLYTPRKKKAPEERKVMEEGDERPVPEGKVQAEEKKETRRVSSITKTLSRVLSRPKKK